MADISITDPSYDECFLLAAKPHLQYYQHWQKSMLPKNQDGLVKFMWHKPLPPIEEHDLVMHRLETYEIEAKPQKSCCGIVAFSLEETILKQNIEILGQQVAAQAINLMAKKIVGGGLLRRRADNNQDYQKDLIMNDNTINSTTVIQHDDLKGTTNWVGARITFFLPLTDQSYGATVKVTGQNHTDGTVTFSPTLDKVPANGTRYRIVSNRDLLSHSDAGANKLTSKALRSAVYDLYANHAEPMQDDNWVCIIDPYRKYDFMDDKSWNDVSTYQDKKNIYNGEIGKWRNIRFVGATDVYKETVAGEYTGDDDNSVHFATLLGRDAYGVVDLEGQGKEIICVKKGQPSPSRSEIECDVTFTTKILNATFGVNIACAVSD
ncbi:MAG: N4-gp56 family major capsid protein [Endomicrobium sp.]|uniref:N4-gp56 family major capsid protein n=1 Tax=Candidatus Endomicrobiellum pyrsonymphae TaxID=1408203 RepID=UPI0035857B48|nr:N4-gp56 family major capsid protein [Endomicrobium sp.]